MTVPALPSANLYFLGLLAATCAPAAGAAPATLWSLAALATSQSITCSVDACKTGSGWLPKLAPTSDGAVTKRPCECYSITEQIRIM